MEEPHKKFVSDFNSVVSNDYDSVIKEEDEFEEKHENYDVKKFVRSGTIKE